MDGPTRRQSALVARLAPPRWYHPAAGAALAVFVASFASRLAVVVGPCFALYLLSLFVLPRAYRRSTGVWYVGEVPPGALRWSRRLAWTSFGAVLLAAVLGASAAAPVAVVVAVGAYALVQVYGAWFDAALRSELLQDPEIAFKIEERDE